LTLRCVHLSDIHWRGLTRHEEYRESFEKMFQRVRELSPDIIFVGGDIVHSKTQGISPELIDCLGWWFTEMASICPTHIILGNHDGLIMNKDRQDAITPVINALNNKNLFLYKKSGVYPTGVKGYNWCVFSCFDEESWADVRPVPGDINIATFHGGVKGSETDIDWAIEGEVTVDFFKDYDFSFLGDIHKIQYLDPEKRIAYPGSTIQQNYGEATGKGFLFWEIEDKDNYKSTFIEVPHSRPFVTVDWAGDIPSTVKACMAYPNMSRFRIRTNVAIPNSEMKQLFGELREIKKATEIVFKNDVDSDLTQVPVASNHFKSDDLRSLATHSTLMRDFYSTSKLSEDEWKKLDFLTAKYFNSAVHSDCVRNIKWSVNRLEFDNMFSYGKGNIINFDNLRGIIGIFGRNRAGKSSIPGTLMYGLYNTTDRGPMSNLHVINMRKGHCETKIDITANGSHYRIERQSVRKVNKGGDVNAVTNLNFYLTDENGGIVKDLNGEQRRDTEKILRDVVGTSDDFLLTSLASQGEMNNFIKYKASQRKTILTKFLDLEIFDEMLTLAKSDSSEIKALLSNVPDRDWDVIIGDLVTEKARLLSEKESAEKELEVMRLKLQQTQINLATSKGASLVTAQDVSDKEAYLDKKRKELSHLNEENESLQGHLASLEEKIFSIAALKKQFPIVELRSRYEARQDLERNLTSLQHAREMENSKTSNYKKSVKLLEEVPCGDSFPKCKFIKNSHDSKKLLEKQQQTISELVDKLGAVKKSLDALDKENLKEKIEKYNSVLEKERDYQVSLSSKQLELNRLTSKMTSTTSIINDTEHELSSMRLRVVDTEEAERASLAKKLISDLTDSVNQKDATRISLAQMIGNIDARVERTKSEKEKYAKLISDWRMYELFINAVSKNGIPLKIMSVQMPAINAEISKILQGVVGFTVELEADPETNEMEIYLNYGDSKRIIECGSGMEKMMASLAIRVALINITTLPKSDILIIDEGFGALDDMNIEACTRLLNSLKKWFKSIMVISHIDAVKDSVENVIDITYKEMNASVVYA
jgi:DNA repair exonuclease SbcCD ATPase subunit